MTQCNFPGCTRAGTHYLRAKVWAMGSPRSSSPITMVIGLQLCGDHAHAEEEDAHPCITDLVWDALRAFTRQQGLMPVDPDSLELEAVRGDVVEVLDRHNARLQ